VHSWPERRRYDHRDGPSPLGTLATDRRSVARPPAWRAPPTPPPCAPPPPQSPPPPPPSRVDEVYVGAPRVALSGSRSGHVPIRTRRSSTAALTIRHTATAHISGRDLPAHDQGHARTCERRPLSRDRTEASMALAVLNIDMRTRTRVGLRPHLKLRCGIARPTRAARAKRSRGTEDGGPHQMRCRAGYRSQRGGVGAMVWVRTRHRTAGAARSHRTQRSRPRFASQNYQPAQTRFAESDARQTEDTVSLRRAT
jgi:hypothetical protein